METKKDMSKGVKIGFSENLFKRWLAVFLVAILTLNMVSIKRTNVRADDLEPYLEETLIGGITLTSDSALTVPETTLQAISMPIVTMAALAPATVTTYDTIANVDFLAAYPDANAANGLINLALKFPTDPVSGDTRDTSTARASTVSSGTAPGGWPNLALNGKRTSGAPSNTNSWQTQGNDTNPNIASSTGNLGIAVKLSDSGVDFDTVVLHTAYTGGNGPLTSTDIDVITIEYTTDDATFSALPTSNNTNTGGTAASDITTGWVPAGSNNWEKLGEYSVKSTGGEKVFVFNSPDLVNAKYIRVNMHRTDKSQTAKAAITINSFEVYNTKSVRVPTLSAQTATFNATQTISLTATVHDYDDLTASSISLDGTTLTSSQVTLGAKDSQNNQTITFSTDYLNTLASGDHVFKVGFKKASIGADADVDAEFKITVEIPTMTRKSAIFANTDVDVTATLNGYSLDKILVKDGNSDDLKADTTKLIISDGTESGSNDIKFLSSYLSSFALGTKVIYVFEFVKPSANNDLVTLEFDITIPENYFGTSTGYPSMSAFEAAEPIFVSHTLTQEEYDAGIKNVGLNRPAVVGSTVGVTPAANLVPLYSHASGGSGAVAAAPNTSLYRASSWNSAAGNGAASYAFTKIRGNGTSLNKFLTSGTSVPGTLTTWHINSGDVNASQEKNIGLAVNLGQNKQFDTVVIYGGYYNNSSGGNDYIVPFTPDYVKSVSVDTATSSTEASTWSTLPTTQTARTWSGTGSIKGVNDGRWVLLGAPKVIDNDGSCVFVFKSETPINAQFVRCSILLTDILQGAAGQPPNSTGSVVVNSFEVYNSLDMQPQAVAYPSISEHNGVYSKADAVHDEVSTVITGNGSTFTTIEAPAELSNFTEGTAYTVEGAKVTFIPEYLDSCTAGSHKLSIKFGDGKYLEYRLTVISPDAVSLKTNTVTYDRTQMNRVSFVANIPQNNGIRSLQGASVINTDYAISSVDPSSRECTVEFQPHFLDSLAVGTYSFTVSCFAAENPTITLNVVDNISGARPNPDFAWYTKSSNKDINVELRSSGGVTVTGISNNGSLVPSAYWNVEGGRLVIKSEYCDTLNVDKHNLTLSLSNGSTGSFLLGIAEKSLIDYSVWQLQPGTYSIAPWDKPYLSSILVGREFNGWWYGGTGSAGSTNLVGWDIFQTSLKGYGTTGSGSIRTELREVMPNTDVQTHWNPKGYHVMETEELVIQVNNGLNSNKTCLGQLWSASSGMYELFVTNNYVFTHHPTAGPEPASNVKSLSGTGESAIFTTGSNSWNSGLATGTPFRLKYEMKNLQLRVYFKTKSMNNGDWFTIYEETVSPVRAFYFKAGNYDQSATNPIAGIETIPPWIPDWSIPHSLVAIRDIQVQHNPVAGALTYDDGTPVVGADVSYSIPVTGVSGVTLTGTVKTDEEGKYFIPNVPYHATGGDPFPQSQPGSSDNDRISPVTITVPASLGGLSPNITIINVPERTVATDIYSVETVVYSTVTEPNPPTDEPEEPTPEEPSPEDPSPEDPSPEDPSPEDPSPEEPSPDSSPNTTPDSNNTPDYNYKSEHTQTTDQAKAFVTPTPTPIPASTNASTSPKPVEVTTKDSTITISVDVPADATEFEVVVPKMTLDKTSDKDGMSLTIVSHLAVISFNNKALKTISEQAVADITIKASAVDLQNLSVEDKSKIENRPVFEFIISDGRKEISDFGYGGKATVSVPYTLAPGEKPNQVVVYYISADGKMNSIKYCKYDAKTHLVTFTTNHFSKYAVGYNPVNFKDTSNSPYSYGIDFVTARGIFKGTSQTNFYPDQLISRAMLVTVISNLDGADITGKKSTFSDVESGAWYEGAVGWAQQIGLVSGIGENKFDPDGLVTREQMAVMINNYVHFKNDEFVLEEVPINKETISAWAREAAENLAGAGIMKPLNGDFAPKYTPDRAEVAQIFEELVHALMK